MNARPRQAAALLPVHWSYRYPQASRAMQRAAAHLRAASLRPGPAAVAATGLALQQLRQAEEVLASILEEGKGEIPDDMAAELQQQKDLCARQISELAMPHAVAARLTN